MSIKQFLSIFLLGASTALLAPLAQEKIIVLAPYADLRSPGRTINGAFERGIALQCAELLKTELEKRIPHTTVVIAKPNSSDFVPSNLSTASFANTLGASFFFAFSFYQEHSPKPHFHIYRYTRESDLPLNQTELALCPYDQIYRLHVTESMLLIKKLYNGFSAQQNSMCEQPCALPIASLTGVAAPAALIEIGIPHDYAWTQIVEPLAAGITHALIT